MRISWDVRARDLPLPATSIVDGSPDAAAVRLNVLGHGGVWILRVAVPLTAGQARRMRPVHLLVLVSAALSVVTGVVVVIGAAAGISGHGEILERLFPYAAGGALANMALVFATHFLGPKQYPRMPFSGPSQQGGSGRIELRDVDLGTAREWRRLAGDAVTMSG